MFSSAALKKQVKERGNKIARRDPRLNVVGLKSKIVGFVNLRVHIETWSWYLLLLREFDVKSETGRDGAVQDDWA